MDFLIITMKNPLVIALISNNEDQLWYALTEFDFITIAANKILKNPYDCSYKFLPFDNSSQAYVKLFQLCGIENLKEDKKKVIHLVTKGIPIFQAVIVNLVEHQEQSNTAWKRTAWLKSHNTCCT